MGKPTPKRDTVMRWRLTLYDIILMIKPDKGKTERRTKSIPFMTVHAYLCKVGYIMIHVQWQTFISMYVGLQQYMLKCGGDRHNDTCVMTNIHKHVSQTMMVHAYIWKVWWIMIHARWPTFIAHVLRYMMVHAKIWMVERIMIHAWWPTAFIVHVSLSLPPIKCTVIDHNTYIVIPPTFHI